MGYDQLAAFQSMSQQSSNYRHEVISSLQSLVIQHRDDVALKTQIVNAIAEISDLTQQTDLGILQIHDCSVQILHEIPFDTEELEQMLGQIATENIHNKFIPLPLNRLLSPLICTLNVERTPHIFQCENVTVNANPDAFRIVWRNLLDNAKCYAGTPLFVTVKGYENCTKAVVQFTDNGNGLSREKCDRVFERGVRFHPETKGDGIGLSLCKEIVEAHGGKIRCYQNLNRYNKGMVFEILLPIHAKNFAGRRSAPTQKIMC